MFENVYLNPKAKSQEGKAGDIILALYNKYMQQPEFLPPSNIEGIERYGKEQVIVDYIASMSDRYVIKIYSDLFVPSVWSIY